MKLQAYGVTTELPPGWEGRATLRRPPAAQRSIDPDAAGAKGWQGEVPNPVIHLANFPLPEDRGDFGSGAVDLMGAEHVFVSLFEYGPESVGQALFSRKGLPTDLTPAMFNPRALQRTLPGQAGCQVFFTEAGRAFCLYVVLGRHQRATTLVPRANSALRATRIGPR